MNVSDYKYGDPFKFKSLRTFSSNEWMKDGTKKYRQVFETQEITYLRWELRFYNKLFDEEDWETKVAIKVFNITNGAREELCNLSEDLKISKENNEITHYQSWGHGKAGAIWNSGIYLVKAYVNDKEIGAEKFYIQENGLVTNKNNPYFDLVSLKLFSGDREAHKQDKYKYLKVFNKEKTQYIWVDLSIKNKLNIACKHELFINFYDDAGNPKAKIVKLEDVARGQKGKIISYQHGWGNNEGGSWIDDKYRLDIVFMDTLIASVMFEMGDKDVEGSNPVKTEFKMGAVSEQSEEKELSLEELIQNLDELIGLEDVKTQIKEHISYLKFLKLREERGFKDNEKISLHSVFTGNPGTGKTTVVKLLGKIYHKMGLLSQGHVHEVDRADLVGEFIGQTAPKVRKAIDEARGGILFIDEAYSLARSKEDSKDFGREVIEIIMKEMSDGEGDIAIMAAGYPNEMKTFMDINPGLKSRFNYYLVFKDYTPDELMAIAELAAKKRSVTLEQEAKNLIYKMLLDAYRDRDNAFGNARFAYSIIDEAKRNLGLRLVKLPNIKTLPSRKLSLVTAEDVKKIKSLNENKKNVSIPIDEELLKISLNKLNMLIGMENIKNEINDTVKLVRYYKETGKDILNHVAKHTVFTGNPGTGKTTVARIISQIYKALGLLERGHIVETSREDLIAGYIGQTAIKTKQKIDEATGGVLFIDEAYALSDDDGKGYGKEAIEVILKTMEDRRGNFVIIAAGYPNNMDEFLKSNPGLKSRFDRTLHFYDYKPDVLQKIAASMFKDNGLTMNQESADLLKSHLQKHYDNKDKYFGNARFVRKIVEQTVKQQHLRMASTPHNMRTQEVMSQITVEDLKGINEMGAKLTQRRKMGF